MTIDLNSLSDARLRADIDYAGKQYAAAVVGEPLKEDPDLTGAQVHEILVQRAQKARSAVDEHSD